MKIIEKELADLNLQRLKFIAKEFNINEYVEPVLTNPNFYYWSGAGSPKRHHYGKHGLLIHTREVVDLCESAYYNLNNSDSLNIKTLLIAAIWHDIGKTYDYYPLDNQYINWDKTLHYKKVNHLVKSYQIWETFYQSSIINYEAGLEVSSMILSHHGKKEWGSPIEPQSQGAWILHLADMMSARVDELGEMQNGNV